MFFLILKGQKQNKNLKPGSFAVNHEQELPRVALSYASVVYQHYTY